MVDTAGIETDEELRARKLRIKQKALELSLKTRDEATLSAEVPSTFQAPQSTLENLAALAAETPHPDLVGAGKVFDDLWRNIKMVGLRGGAAVSRQAPPPSIPADLRQNELMRLSREAQDNQELFDILAQRRPAASGGEFFTALGIAYAVPGARSGPGSLLTAPRRISMASELTAGGVLGLTSPAASPEQVEFNTLTGTVIGGSVFKVMTGVNRLGQVMIGGRPATLQRVDDLKTAENDLGVTGLLTTGEIRGGRLMQKVEGVFDNMPLPMFGLSGKRETQGVGFQNAVLQIQAAFPEISEDQAKKLLVRRLGKLSDGVTDAYAQVAKALPDNAPNVQMTHFVSRAEKFLAEELQKGASANQSVIVELEGLIKHGPVDFITATKIAGDLGVKIRKAERAATDPTATGIDAGRQKQLSIAFFRDIETWAKQFPENSTVVKLWESAKQQYKDNILPFNKRPFAPMFDDAGFDSFDLSKAILDPFKAGKLSQLDESNALAFLFVNNAITEATRSGQVNVKQLANTFAKAKNQKALAPILEGLPPESTRMINSLVKLVDAAPRQFTSNANILRTTAGAAAGLAVVGGGAASSEDPISGALRGVVTLGLMRWALGSPSGRKLLTAASLVPVENRAALGEIGRRLNQGYQRFMETAVLDRTDEAADLVKQEADRFGIRVTGPSLRDRP